MSELLIVAILVMVLNVLDSTTTYLGFKQYPDKELKGETNPFMRVLMLKSKWLAEVVKQGGVLAIVIVLFLDNEIYSMRLVGLVLGLVVLNNAYVIISRAVMRRKVISPGRGLQELCHMSGNITYFVMMTIIICLALLINNFIFVGR